MFIVLSFKWFFDTLEGYITPLYNSRLSGNWLQHKTELDLIAIPWFNSMTTPSWGFPYISKEIKPEYTQLRFSSRALRGNLWCSGIDTKCQWICMWLIFMEVVHKLLPYFVLNWNTPLTLRIKRLRNENYLIVFQTDKTFVYLWNTNEDIFNVSKEKTLTIPLIFQNIHKEIRKNNSN